MEDGEEDEEEEGEEEEEEEDEEAVKPKKRIGRPPKLWSSVLLPKEVTSTLGSCRPTSGQAKKANLGTKISNPNVGGEGAHSKQSTPSMVGQTVHGVVDGCFDAGFLVSLRMGDSDSLFRGVVFGPGLSIPVSKETDIAKNVKRKRRNRKIGSSTGAVSREEPATSPPPLPLPAPPREEAPPLNLQAPTQAPHYEAPPVPQHAQQPNSGLGGHGGVETTHISPPIPPPHPHQYAYNGGALHPNSFRSPHVHPELNVNPNPNAFMHSPSFPPRPAIPMPQAQGYSPRQNFAHAMPSPSTPYGYNFAGPHQRPSTPLPPQYRGPPDPQYRGP